MKYLILATWRDNHPTRFNIAETEDEAKSMVAVLKNKGRTETFYVKTKHAVWNFDPKYMTVNPDDKTITWDTVTEAADIAAEQWADLRKERDARLQETDFYSLSDVTMSNDMKTYRQELRDLPANTTDPTDVTWPTKPS